MDLNIIYMLIGAAVFVLPVVYMLGYARHEKQQAGWSANAREGFNLHRSALQTHYENALSQERNVVRELEISLLQAGESIELGHQELEKITNQWKYADNYRKAIVNYMVINHIWDFGVHSDDPMAMLAEIIKRETMIVMDPLISKAAKNLITRGVRKGAKAGREQMRKLMQKCIDNQAATIRHYDECVHVTEMMRSTYMSAVHNVLDDKIALKSVRKSLKQAIIVETGRLRAVHAQKAAQ